MASLNKPNMVGLALAFQSKVVTLFSRGLTFDEISSKLDNAPLDIVKDSLKDYLLKNKLV